MEIRIGVVYTPKELSVELPDGKDAASDVVKALEKALDDGKPMLWLTDAKGRRVGVPVDKVAYVEIATDDDHKRVGFGR